MVEIHSTDRVSWWDIRTALALRGATEQQCMALRDRIFLVFGKILHDRAPIPALCLRSLKIYAPTLIGEEKTRRLVEDILSVQQKEDRPWKKV